MTIPDHKGALSPPPQPMVVVHVGYPRTGTTFLQKHLFGRLSGFVGKTSRAVRLLDGDESPAEAASALGTQEPIVISRERLASSWRYGDTPEMADLLRARFPQARIVIVVRSPFEIFRSFYFLQIKGGGLQSYRHYVRARLDVLFRYDKLVDHYITLFGREAVLVLLYEDLRAEPRATMARLLDFMGYDPKLAEDVPLERVKPTPKEAVLYALRLRNFVLAPLHVIAPALHSSLILRGLPGASILGRFAERLTRLLWPTRSQRDEALEDEIRAAYAEPYRALFKRLGIDVSRYRYPSN
jgi:hypothetical protein